MKKKNVKTIIAIVSVVLLVLSSLSLSNIAIFAENSAEIELSAIDASIEETYMATEELATEDSDNSDSKESESEGIETTNLGEGIASDSEMEEAPEASNDVESDESKPEITEDTGIAEFVIDDTEAVDDVGIPDYLPETSVAAVDPVIPTAVIENDITPEQSSGTYYINYIMFGGTNNAQNLTSVSSDSSELVKFYPPTKAGFEFVGWYTDKYSPDEIQSWNVGHTPHQQVNNWALNSYLAYGLSEDEADYWWHNSFVPNRMTGYSNLKVYDNNIYVLATWLPVRYSVTFDGNGGTYNGKSSVQNTYTYGSGNTCPNITFYRKGYTFNGFLISKNGCYNNLSGAGYTACKPSAIGDLDQMVSISEENNSSFVLTADWTKDKYSIQYVLNGGTSNSNPTSYTIDDTVKLQDVSRTGYKFGGWFRDSSFTNQITQIAQGSTGNQTLYAKWVPYTYSITYNKNGGSGSMTGTTGCKYGTSYKLPKNAFTKKNYTFTGWNTKADGTGTAYANSASVKNLTSKNGGKVILYAQWKLTEYKITYYLNGGSNHPNNPATYNIKKGVTLGSPSRSGYTFAGWYADKNYKTKSSTIKQGSTGAKAFYAKWTAHKYTIAYNRNGGTGTAIANKTGCVYGKTYTLAKNTYKKNGYTFIGWNTKADGSGKNYDNGASVKNLTTKNGGKVTLYATWAVTEYPITYNLNGGRNTADNPMYYTQFQAVTLKKPSRTGYTFAGWYSDKNFKNKVTTIAKGSTGSKTFYAKWTANKYTITYNGNGATGGTMANTSCTYGNSVSLRKNGYTRRGYTFAGWSKNADGSGTVYANGASVKNLTGTKNGTVNLYAQWRTVTYTITYVLNGGENAADNPTTYTVNSTDTLKNPTKTRSVFLGWYTDEACTNQITTLSGMTGNLTLYASWRDKVQVTCSRCGGDGKMACSHCGGSGRKTCTICGGAGKKFYNHEYLTCKTCNGAKYVNCFYCRGYCTEDCTLCGGYGYIWQ